MNRYGIGTTDEVAEDCEGDGFYTVDDLVANGDWETIQDLAYNGDPDAIRALDEEFEA